MNWFNKHLNWTLFLAVLTGNIIYLAYFLSAPEDNINPLFIVVLVLMAVIVLGTEVWYLRKKRRSLFWLFANLLNWIGFIVILTLENRTIIEPESLQSQPTLTTK